MLNSGPRVISGFTPLNLANLVGFWRADQGVSAPGGGVTTWADQSGNANTLVPPFSGLPAFSSTGFNSSFPGLTFSGVSGSSQTPLANTTFNFVSAAISVFVLADLTSAQVSDAGLISFGKSPLANDFSAGDFVIALNHLGVTNTWTAYSNGGMGDGGSVAVPYSPTITMLGFTVDGAGNANVWVNGAVVGPPSAGVASFGANPNSIYIGARPLVTPAQGFPLNGTVAFWGITAAAMTSSDWLNLKNWANANWGTAF